jgi:hypothetical protein
MPDVGDNLEPQQAVAAFDVARCRESLTLLKPRPEDRNVILREGPLDGCRFPVDRAARPGATVGVTQMTPLGMVSVQYRLAADGAWRFTELSAIT